MNAHLKIGICIPSGHTWDADFAMCLINLFAHVLTRPMPGVRQVELVLANERTSLIPKSRQGLIEKAIRNKCDYALFIDSDQTFPSNLLYRLLKHEKKVVACNIATKSIPSSPTARNEHPTHPGGDVVYSDPHKHGLEKVWRIGTGVMLVDMKVFNVLKKPWFSISYDDEQSEFIGEDWWFCRKLEEQGIEIYIDHDMSREIGHVGCFTFTHDLIGEIVRQEAA